MIVGIVESLVLVRPINPECLGQSRRALDLALVTDDRFGGGLVLRMEHAEALVQHVDAAHGLRHDLLALFVHEKSPPILVARLVQADWLRGDVDRVIMSVAASDGVHVTDGRLVALWGHVSVPSHAQPPPLLMDARVNFAEH